MLAQHCRARAVVMEVKVLLVHSVAYPHGGFTHLRRIGHRQLLLTAHRNSLEVLGAHHGAHAGAPSHLIEIVDDQRVSDEVLSGYPRLRHTDQSITALGANGVFHLSGLLAPQMLGVPDLNGILVHPYIDRCLRAALDDDTVIAGV